MRYKRACADANILGHLYRSGESSLLNRFFEQVLVDQWILDEIKRKQKDILPLIERELSHASFLLLVDRAELQNRQVLSLYETELDDMRNLFLPPDEGEKRVIALARAIGVSFVLTDDEKPDGPYWSIERGIISHVEALAFWDLVYMSILDGGYSDYIAARESYNRICQQGYHPPYAPGFGSRMAAAVRRLKDKEWFKQWCQARGVKAGVTIELLKQIKQAGW